MLRLGGDKLTDKTSKTVNNPLRENSNPVQFLRKKHQTLEELSHFFESESIFVKTKDAQKQPEINKLISEMEKAGALESLVRGVFIDTTWSPNDFLIRQLMLKQGIYSGPTALYLWELSNQYPYKVYMTFKRGYRLPTTKSLQKWTESVVVRQNTTDNLDDAVMHLDVARTNQKIRLYSRERTLVEILREPYALNNEVVNTAYRRYLDSPDGNASLLLMTAKQMGALKKVRQRLEIML